MVVRIHNLSKWSRIEPGNVLHLEGDHLRKIRVEVNCVEPTAFHVLEGDEPVFLAVVQGHQLLEFAAAGTVDLVPSTDGDVWYFTTDGGIDATESIEASFTTIASRKARNPQLELMMWKQEQNMRRREAALAEELAAFRASIAAQGVDSDTGEVDDDDATAANGTERSSDGDVGAGEATGAGSEPAKPAKKAGAADGKS